jgi:hypothetical protein
MPVHPTLRLRLTWPQRRAFVLTVLGFQTLVWGDVLLNDGRFGGGPGTALAGLVLVLMAAATWWVGTSATKRGIVVHAVPSMVIPWEEVREIEVTTQLGVKTVVVHHGTTVRRRTRLSAPTTGPLGRDDAFLDKVHDLRREWAAHRASGPAAAA